VAARIDLNCDLGEGAGSDAAILPFITSANVACGYHAGDKDTMRVTTRSAMEHGVAIGAHPGLRDREGFGRRVISLATGQARELVRDQLDALSSIVSAQGGTLRHVKPHGALYHMATTDRGIAEEIAEAVHAHDPRLVLVGFPGSALLRAGEQAGLRGVAEAFADRTYQSDGSLTPRIHPGALIETANRAVAQVLRLIREKKVQTPAGDLEVHAETICIHGDGPHAVEFAREIRRRLEREGIEVAPPWA
jgi:UPF0271 protein